MSLPDPAGQLNPQEDGDFAFAELKQKVERTVKVLDENKPAIYRWFWRALFAFNLILWSVALPIGVLLLLA